MKNNTLKYSSPNSQFTNVCNYLQRVLNFRDYVKIPEKYDDYVSITQKEFLNGDLEQTTVDNLNKWIKKTADNNNNEKNGSSKGSVDIIIVPKILCDIIQKATCTRGYKGDAWEYEKISLFYIKAKYVQDSGLQCINGESLVWADPIICKKEDAESDCHLATKGVVFAMSDAKTPLNCDNGWSDYIKTVESVYEERTGQGLFAEDKGDDTLVDIDGKKHELSDEIVIMKDSTVFAQSSIVKLLDDISVNRCKKALFWTMICGSSSNMVNKHKLGTYLGAHRGQMKPDYPLADAQRDVLHCFNQLEYGYVLAVSGPPGTGKTTVLQSIVAQMIVNSTLSNIDDSKKANQETDIPSSPLILATSANNKAITNIIDAFAIEDKLSAYNPLYGRWLYCKDNNRMLPLAVFMPSVSAKNKDKYFCSDNSGGMGYGIVREYYIEHSDEFLETANKSLNTSKSSVSEIQDYLKERLRSCNIDIQKIRRLVEKEKYIPKEVWAIIKKYSIDTKQCEGITWDYVNQGNLDNKEYIDKYLDQTLRHHLFWLAVHYNECVWISKMQQLKEEKDSSPKGEIKKVYGSYLFDEMKYVCPCIVATIFRAPTIFSYTANDKNRSYNYNKADLLIVDEAGQINPELGLPIFSLAKKAVVVGDVKQIPPIYSITEEIDDVYRKKEGIDDDTHRLLSCSSSSIMNVAMHKSKIHRVGLDGEMCPGLFLNEHRRCFNEIIQYSDELLYDGELKPMRGKGKEKCVLRALPPMCIFNVQSASQVEKGSRYNKGELDAIKEWIQANQETIEKIYKKDIKELVNIITPFKAQVMQINKDADLNRFPHGTVHTFQGAESPIVIFSMVYGADDSPTFIKNNHELMNVAVSRAKDHFIVFGSKECLYRNQTDKACKLLYEMTQDIDNDSLSSSQQEITANSE